jgi:uncharacterized Zn-finger protein
MSSYPPTLARATPHTMVIPPSGISTSHTSKELDNSRVHDRTKYVQASLTSHGPEQRSSKYLAIPDDTLSEPSVTPDHLPDVLYCQHEGCSLRFTGIHRRGTLHRHVRLKHMSGQASRAQAKTYSCPVESCDKAFKRQDARLKHCRTKHPELGMAAPVRRIKNCSTI